MTIDNFIVRADQLLEEIDQLLKVPSRPGGFLTQTHTFAERVAEVSVEGFAQWRAATTSFFTNLFGAEHTYYQEFREWTNSNAVYNVSAARGVLKAARDELAGGWLRTAKGLVAAELFSNLAISEFPKGRKYLISLSFRGKASVRPAQVGGFDVNIVIHGSTAVRGRGDLVAYRWALWKLTAPWTHRTRPPHLGKRCAFSTSFHRAFPIKSFTKNPERPQNSVGKPG